jgi:hypothetical protein
MSDKPISRAQIRLLLGIAAGRSIGHHDGMIIEALQRRGLVVGPRIDANGKYIPPALTALGKAEVEQRQRRLS